MPNGDYHEDRPLDIQVRDLMDEARIWREGMEKARELIKELIKENKEIRNLAQLPTKEYPNRIEVRQTNWLLEC